MKKVLITALALALPALASAQVKLISGYNFGQFLSEGTPSLDGTTGDFVGSVGANFAGTNVAPGSSSGDFVVNNGLTGNYSNGTGRAYWDGTNGSSNYALDGVAIVAFSNGGNTANTATVQGTTMGFNGDGGNLQLRSTVAGNSISFVTNTTGFTDYDPTAFSQAAGVNDSNFTFAAFATGAPSSVSFFLNGSNAAFAVVSVAAGTASSVYAVDLPVGFYGLSAAQVVAQIGGTVTFDNVQFNGVAAIPEPSTYAAILGALTLGFVALRRRFQAAV